MWCQSPLCSSEPVIPVHTAPLCQLLFPYGSLQSTEQSSLCCTGGLVAVQLLSRVRLLRPHGLQPARLLCPWDSPGKNTGVGCHFLLQGSSPPGDQMRVSCTAGGFFISEPPGKPTQVLISYVCILKVLSVERSTANDAAHACVLAPQVCQI